MKAMFASRKFTTAILGALLVALNDALRLGLKEDTIQLVVLMLASWIVGESAIDAAGAWRAQSTKLEVGSSIAVAAIEHGHQPVVPPSPSVGKPTGP